MSAKLSPKYGEVLAAVSAWPPTQRAALIYDLLRTLLPEPEDAEQQRREALERLNGILAPYGPAPSDEDVERWLEERRLAKYG